MAPHSKKQAKTLVLIHDGKTWYAGLYHQSSWQQTQLDDPHVEILPESLLEWGDTHGALQVRVVVPAELETLELPTAQPVYLDPATLHQQLNEAAAIKQDCDTDSIATAMASVNRLGMGDAENHLVGAIFDRQMILAYTESCEHHGLRFEGVTSQLSLLLAYAALHQLPADHALLSIGLKRSYVIGRAEGESLVSYRDLPITFAEEDPEQDRRAERRLRTYLHKGLVLTCPANSLPHYQLWLQGLDPELSITTIDKPNFRLTCFDIVANASPYMLEDPLGFAILPPPPKDDKYIGSILCVALIVLTAGILGAMWSIKTLEKNRLTALRTSISTLESEQKRASDGLKAATAKLNHLRNLYTLLQSSPAPLTGSFDAIYHALSKTTPKFSTVTKIEQLTDRLVIHGQTRWAQEVSPFAQQLQEAIHTTHKKVVPLVAKPNPDDPTLTDFILEVK